MVQLNPYLGFRGTAREAMEFYQSVLGGELEVTTFADASMPGVSEGDADLVMHSQLTAPGGLTLMAGDAPSGMEVDSGSAITIALTGSEEEELRGYWEKLSDGANVTAPLEPAPWGDVYGQLTDRFGVNWMVDIWSEQQAQQG